MAKEKTKAKATKKPAKAKSTKVTKAKSTAASKADVKGALDEAKMLMNSYLDDSISGIEKSMGLSATAFDPDEPRLSTGLISLDVLIGGGIVSGGWYTIFGGEQSCKSTLTMLILASIVKQGFDGKAAIWDYEGSTDPSYVENILKSAKVKQSLSSIFGEIDPETGDYIIQPLVRYISHDSGEDFFDYYNRLKRALPDKTKMGKGYYYVFPHEKKYIKMFKGAYDKEYLSKRNKIRIPAEDGMAQALALVDSYPAMLPALLDEDGGSKAIGSQARMFSDGIKRVKSGMRKKRMTIFGVNQLRLKPMVMFGCFYYTSKVLLADGTTKNIGEIVNGKLDVEVMSYNRDTGTFEPKRVVNWFRNGEAEQGDFIKIKVQTGHANGYTQIPCTRNHMLQRWNAPMDHAGNFNVGDELTTFKEVSTFNDDQYQMLLGSMLGDGCFSHNGRYARFGFGHGSEQEEYCSWKHAMLSTYANDPYTNSRGGMSFETKPLYHKGLRKAYAQYSEDLGHRTYSGVPSVVLNNLDMRGLAVWYMDDGTNHANSGNSHVARLVGTRFSDDTKSELLDMLNSLTGLNWKSDSKGFVLNVEDTKTFFTLIAPYIHASMLYKVDGLKSDSYTWNSELGEVRTVPVPAPIVSIEEQKLFKGMSKIKYDLEVEGNHTYIVGNCVVHNSPEYEPGGEALRFYSDVRLKSTSRAIPPGWGKGQTMEEPSVEGKGSDEYRFIVIKVHKNKLGGFQYQDTWARMWLRDHEGQARGLDPVFDTWNFLKMQELVGGTRKNMKFAAPCPLEGAKKMTWDDFKVLILGKKQQVIDKCKEKEIKPVDIRLWCKKQVASGNSMKRFSDILAGSGDAVAEDDED